MTTLTPWQKQAREVRMTVMARIGQKIQQLQYWPTIQLIIQRVVKFTSLLAWLSPPPMQLRWHSSHASWTFRSPLPPLRPEVLLDHYFNLSKNVPVQHPSLFAHTCTRVRSSFVVIYWVPQCLVGVLHKTCAWVRFCSHHQRYLGRL